MAKIELKNFRRFEHLQPLELGWINLLVGKNNAGKSTIVKAIMLLLDNMRSLQWTNVISENGMCLMQKAPKPLFRFDANGFHNLHIGTFERAKCNYINENRITIDLEYEDVELEVTIADVSGNEQISMPIEKIKITLPKRSSYELDFFKGTMSVSFIENDTLVKKSKIQNNLELIEREISGLSKELDKAVATDDVLKSAEINNQIESLQIRKLNQQNALNRIDGESPFVATFDLSYFHESIGENILAQYLRTFTRLFKIQDAKKIVSDYLSSQIDDDDLILENPEDYFSEEELSVTAEDFFIEEHSADIENDAQKLENLLNNISVDYIQAHAATQKLILSIDDKQDVNSQVIHEYFQEKIQTGERADIFVKKWLKEFEIGEDISINPLDGEGYYVKINTGSKEVHLADMGMGSIQLIILLLRLATIGNRCERTLKPSWVMIEEPEQNLHPMLQSKLADMFYDYTQTFCDPYSITMIVETHSEYIIRRTQVIVAESYENFGFGDFNPFKVIYFPSEKDKQPYVMEYQADGKFANDFGKGFFDEAENLAFAIL